MSSENLWKPLVFDIFRWLNRNRILAWNELTVDLKVLTSRIQQPVPRVHSLASSVQRPASRVQRLESSVQSPASRVQKPASRVQSPASRVQCPTLASRVQEFRYAHFNSSHSQSSKTGSSWLIKGYADEYFWKVM